MGAHKNKLIQYIQLFQYVHFHIGKFHFMGFKPHRVGNKEIFSNFSSIISILYWRQADIKGAQKNKLKFHFMGFKPHRVGNKGIFQIFHQLYWFCIKGKQISRVFTKTNSTSLFNYFNLSILTLESSILWVLSPIVWKIKEFFKFFINYIDFPLQGGRYQGCSQK